MHYVTIYCKVVTVKTLDILHVWPLLLSYPEGVYIGICIKRRL